MTRLSAAAAESYWDAVVAGDDRAAFDRLETALREGVPLPQVLRGMPLAAQHRIGTLWEADTWSVPQEHAATAVSQQVLQRLLTRGPPADADRGETVVVACVEREWHSLPALVLAVTLQHHGLHVDLLGADTSVERLHARLTDAPVRAVLLSASLSSAIPAAHRHVEASRAHGVPVIAGGSAFDRDGVRARAIGASAFAASAEAVLEQLDRLPARVPPVQPLTGPGPAAARRILHQERVVAARLVHATRQLAARLDRRPGDEATPSWCGVLVDAAPYCVGAVAAACLTGDEGVLDELGGWARRVLRPRAAPSGVHEAWWAALAEAVRDTDAGDVAHRMVVDVGAAVASGTADPEGKDRYPAPTDLDRPDVRD
ncbi:B12-binding domain-containing protein [Nocardioides sp.]|uniref:cobalamin B12-binding domain-containing protein n=1 Tax=Nocardioides sp. TaxID=35761 RepID=UPI00271886BD|nr:cobalamin-dependent protein [Nocardioides sp.]MDO9457594.1 cobalamin-dependent protein [Nocardioides sp.]